VKKYINCKKNLGRQIKTKNYTAATQPYTAINDNVSAVSGTTQMGCDINHTKLAV